MWLESLALVPTTRNRISIGKTLWKT